MGLQHLPELLEDAPQPGQVVSRVAGGLRSSGPVPWLWGLVGSRMLSSYGICPYWV